MLWHVFSSDLQTAPVRLALVSSLVASAALAPVPAAAAEVESISVSGTWRVKLLSTRLTFTLKLVEAADGSLSGSAVVGGMAFPVTVGERRGTSVGWRIKSPLGIAVYHGELSSDGLTIAGREATTTNKADDFQATRTFVTWRRAPIPNASPVPPPLEIIALAERSGTRLPIVGTRSLTVVRQDEAIRAVANINYLDQRRCRLDFTESRYIAGMSLLINNGSLTQSFPGESTLFRCDLPEFGDDVKDVVLGKVCDDASLLLRNYVVTVAQETENVAHQECFKLTFEPARGFGPQSPPGRRMWIGKATGLVMRDERYWSPDQQSYLVSQYDSVSTSQRPIITAEMPKFSSEIALSEGDKHSVNRFVSVAAARAAGKTVRAPRTVPAGFRLEAVDVMNAFDSEAVSVRYTDGLARFTVTYKVANASFTGLLTGLSSIKFLDGLRTLTANDLAYQIPNNYAVIEKDHVLIYAFGDLWVDTLKEVANSVAVSFR